MTNKKEESNKSEVKKTTLLENLKKDLETNNHNHAQVKLNIGSTKEHLEKLIEDEISLNSAINVMSVVITEMEKESK